jgi:hypothetical protein
VGWFLVPQWDVLVGFEFSSYDLFMWSRCEITPREQARYECNRDA